MVLMRTFLDVAKGLTTEDKRVPVSQPLGDIRVRVYTPDSQEASETFPVYVHIHGKYLNIILNCLFRNNLWSSHTYHTDEGGGYSIGTVDTDEFYCRGVSVKHHVIIVSVDYRLAPQFPWPTGPEDSYEAVKWVCIISSSTLLYAIQ